MDTKRIACKYRDRLRLHVVADAGCYLFFKLISGMLVDALQPRSVPEACAAKACTDCIDKSNRGDEYVGIFDIFKIGVGPSSSHTVGPMWAGKQFAEGISQHGGQTVCRIEAHLYGSLALTGKGHATDKATVLGLAGYEPATIDPDSADATFQSIIDGQRLALNGTLEVDFNFDVDVIFHMDRELPLHPNGMTLRALSEDAGVIQEETYYSIGGGFIKTERELSQDDDGSPTTTVASSSDDESTDAASPGTTTPAVPYDFHSASELMALCEAHDMTIAEVMVQNECVRLGQPRSQIFAKLDAIAAVIDGCVERGLRVEGNLPVSKIPRRAAQIRRRINQNMERSLNDPLTASDWIALYARAVNEENACGGRVVTAPTNGAAGTLPAVLTYYRRSVPMATQQGVRISWLLLQQLEAYVSATHPSPGPRQGAKQKSAPPARWPRQDLQPSLAAPCPKLRMLLKLDSSIVSG